MKISQKIKKIVIAGKKSREKDAQKNNVKLLYKSIDQGGRILSY